MNKIKQLRSRAEKEIIINSPPAVVGSSSSTSYTWLEELWVELLSTGPRLPGVLPGAHGRVVGLLRLAPSCGRPGDREDVSQSV